MADITKAGTSLLDMPSIGEYLNIAMGFITKEDKATDTVKVGDVSADSIAIAGRAPAGDERNLRRRVDGAYFLIDGEGNRHAFSDFLLSDEGNKMAGDNKTMGERFSDELQSLRDELTQLRLELSRKGYTEAYQPYAGFYDRFDSNHKNHLAFYTSLIEDSQGVDATSMLQVDDKSFEAFAVGDHVLLHSISEQKYELCKIEAKGDNHKTLMLSNKLAWVPKAGDELFKSYGEVSNSSFIFGEMTTSSNQVQNNYSTGLDDDTYKTHDPLKINDLNTGFAYTVRIPSNLQGKLLKSVQLMVQRHGTPAPLKCYLIQEKNLNYFQNPLQAREQRLLIGESEPLTVDASKGTHVVSFKMTDPYKDDTEKANYANPHNYPYLADKDETTDTGLARSRVRYALIITTDGITPMDSQNYYDLIAVTNGTETELQTNNMLYNYKQVATGSVQSATKTDDELNKADLYYTFSLVDALEEVFAANDKGVYAAHFNTPDSKASSIRITMRVGREGMYHVDNQTGNYTAGTKISFSTDTGKNYQADLSNIGSKPLVIGTTICHAAEGSMDQNRFNIKEALYLEKGDKLYPVGYSVRVKAKLIEWDDTNAMYVTKDEGTFDAPFTTVLADSSHERETSSDRLVFETNFGGRRFNDFEFEVYWEASSTKTRGAEIGGAEDTTKAGKELAGRIYDVVATVTDRFVPKKVEETTGN